MSMSIMSITTSIITMSTTTNIIMSMAGFMDSCGK